MTTSAWANRKFKKRQDTPNHHYWEKVEMTDKELWSSAFNAVANATNSLTPDAALKWQMLL